MQNKKRMSFTSKITITATNEIFPNSGVDFTYFLVFEVGLKISEVKIESPMEDNIITDIDANNSNRTNAELM